VVSEAEAFVLAADIGGTYMRAALVHHTGQVLVRRTVPTPAHDDAPEALVDLIRNV
jgi:predicted NBD/HSP70 family sugar kinase